MADQSGCDILLHRGESSFMWSMYVALAMPLPEANCPQPVSEANIQKELTTLEKAFVAKNIQGVRDAYTKTNASLTCLNEPISPETARLYHLFSGLIAWLDNEKGIFKQHVTFLKTIDSKSSIKTELFPEGHVIHSEFQSVEAQGFGASVKKPKGGKIYIDGVSRGKRVLDSPTILQLKIQNDAWQTILLKPTEPLPEYPVDNYKQPALWTAAGVATLGLGLFATSLKYKFDYEAVVKDGITASDREPLTFAYERNQTFGIAGYTATGLSIAIGTWAVLQK